MRGKMWHEPTSAVRGQVHFLYTTREKSGNVGCDKNVIVLGSYSLKSGMNGSERGRCNLLTNIVESGVFKLGRNTPVFSGTRGRAFKSPRARHLIPCAFHQFC
jgi:hypothetical protein